MADIKLPPTRLAVLRGVAAGKVRHQRNWDLSKPAPDVWEWIPGANRTVTADMAKLREHGLVRIGRALSTSLVSSQVWELTDAGERYLASQTTEES